MPSNSANAVTPAQLLSGIERLFTLGSGREASAGGVPPSGSGNLNSQSSSTAPGRSVGTRRSFDPGRASIDDTATRLSTNASSNTLGRSGTDASSNATLLSASTAGRYTSTTSTGDPIAEASVPSLATGQDEDVPGIGSSPGNIAANGTVLPEPTNVALLGIPFAKLMTETASRAVESVEETEGVQTTSRATDTQSGGGQVAGHQISGTGTTIGGNLASAQSGGNSASGGNSGNGLGTSAGTAAGGSSVSGQIDRAQVISQVTQHLESMRLSNGNGEMRVQLTPEHLGNVQVSVATHQDGVVARISVETAQIQQVMEGAREHLRSTLEARGVRVNSVEVTVTQNPVGSDSGSNAAFAGQRQSQANTDRPELVPSYARRGSSVTGIESNGVGGGAATATGNSTSSGGGTRLDYRA